MQAGKNNSFAEIRQVSENINNQKVTHGEEHTHRSTSPFSASVSSYDICNRTDNNKAVFVSFKTTPTTYSVDNILPTTNNVIKVKIDSIRPSETCSPGLYILNGREPKCAPTDNTRFHQNNLGMYYLTYFNVGTTNW